MPKRRSQKWYWIDAEGKVLGRLASRVSLLLQGKHKPEYTPYEDQGDFVIVTNVEKIRITGNKKEKKIYYHHSLYPGGLKSRTLGTLMQKDPAEVFRKAVKNMLPKNRLAKKRLKKLKVYSGSQHPHQSNGPVAFEVGS